MITLKGNIEFLSLYNAWRRDISDTQHIPMQNPTEIGLNLDYAVASLAMLEQMIHDVATGELVHRVQQFIGEYGCLDENKFDSAANNGDAL